MASDSVRILNFLVRSGLWSIPGNLLRFERIIIDVESLIGFVYRLCIRNHLQRQQAHLVTNQAPELYSATLVDYSEFSRLIKQLFDFLDDHQIEPILVYEGKHMEAPLFGLLAGEFARNTRLVSEAISQLNKYDKSPSEGWASFPIDQLTAPNLALTIFKSIVSLRRNSSNNKTKLRAYQAFYSSYPQMAKLARDFTCPVLTNNGDFIILDVRAGFILIEQFWMQHVDWHDLVSPNFARRNAKTSSKFSPPEEKNSGHKKASRSPPSRIVSVAHSGGKNRSPGGGANYLTCKFHYNSLFLRQHPGLSAPLAMNLFPLTSTDLILKYLASLKRLRVYESSIGERDFNFSQSERTHHLAARRFESTIRFLAGKTSQMLGNFIRSESTRTNSSLDDDYRNLFNYYAIGFEFKHRLRFALKYLQDPKQLRFIELCLIERECTADFLLSLLCCSIGRLASVSYNKHLQFEDLAAKRSAYSLQNRAKSMLMSLLSANKVFKSEHSISLSSKQPETATRYSTASLTIVDRDKSKLSEESLSTSHDEAQLDALRDRLQLAKVASGKQQVSIKQDAVKFINLTFGAQDLTQVPAKLAALMSHHLPADNQHEIGSELAIILSLQRSSHLAASKGDEYFAKAYSSLGHHFELAIINHCLIMNANLIAKDNLKPLMELVEKRDLESVSSSEWSTSEHESDKLSGKKSSKSLGSKSSSGSNEGAHLKMDHTISRHIRHLIELLCSSLDLYCQLNAFFGYPLAKLRLHSKFNPILLYNLTSFSYGHKDNKILQKP